MELFKGRPETNEGRTEREIRCYDWLDRLQIPYWRTDHPDQAAYTMEACREIDAVLEAVVCKNLFLTNRQFAFARILDGSAVITAVNNDDQPAHMEIPLPIEADLAKNLLSRLEEAEEDKEAAARERAARMQAAKDGLMEKAGQLIGASGEIRQKADHVKEAAEKIDVNGERLSEQMENFQRVFREFASACGMEINSDSSASALTCESVELKDGRLILDLAANSGMVIWTGKEKG